MNNKKIEKRVIQLYEKLELSNEIKLPEKDTAQLIRHGAHIIFQLDTHNHFIYLNPAWETATGVPLAKAIKHSLFNFVHEREHDFLRKKLQRIRTSTGEHSFRTECRLKVNGNQIIHVETQLIYSSENNKAQHVMGIMVDISKHKLFLENLILSNKRLSWALSGANDGYWDWNMETNYVYYSSRWKAMLGYSDRELPSQNLETWEKLVSPEDKSRVLKLVDDYVAGHKEKFEIEFKMRHKQGRWVTVLSRASLARDNKGNLIYPKRLIGTHVDLTERKQSELQLKIQNIALEAAANAIMITDIAATIEWINPAFTELTGYYRHEAVGVNVKDLMNSGQQGELFYQDMWRTISSKNVWKGEIINKKKDGTLYHEHMTITPVTNDSDQICYYIAIKEDISQRKASEKEILDLAFYDALTKLPNRRLFLDRLRHTVAACQRNKTYNALLFIDLDNFKFLNDTHGHDAGDALLIEAAKRITNCIRETDTVARLGGDEFVVMLEQLGSDDNQAMSITTQVAESILNCLHQEYRGNNIRHRGSSSIGICMFSDQYSKADDILKWADKAMYEAKCAGRNTLRFFDPHMQQELERRTQLEKELWIAVDKNQFRLHYQLLIDQHQQFVGAEALLRWQHPDKGIVGPNEFLSLIENNGYIIPIGDWIIDEGIRQLQFWQQHDSLKSLTLSLNISAVQFQESGFVQKLKRKIEQSHIDYSRLILELTESSLINHIDDTVKKINELRTLGIRLSIDDFGTGYSSLSYLKRFKLAQLKIERMFVRDILTSQDDLTLVKTIINMGKNLGLDIVAEGVENQQQFEVLKDAGCAKFQGYWINKPIPGEQITALVTSKQHQCFH
ncbi:MAG: EAL domain-containing protein [Nitrosomonas sp.]|nr:EAL domain-containing protein [Nitrosomonas sp.]